MRRDGATRCPCGIQNAVAADVSRLELLPRRNNERTDVRCYDWIGERDRSGRIRGSAGVLARIRWRPANGIFRARSGLL